MREEETTKEHYHVLLPQLSSLDWLRWDKWGGGRNGRTVFKISDSNLLNTKHLHTRFILILDSTGVQYSNGQFT